MNERMRILLGEYADTPWVKAGRAPDEVIADLKDGFDEISGCVLHHRPEGWEPLEFDRQNGDDETGLECLHSKVNFIDFSKDFDVQLPMGLAYAFALKDVLEKSKVGGPLRIIVSADPEPPYPSVTVRYHRVRPDQPWLGDELDRYREGVMAVDLN